jgi:hypothetical protein
MNRQTSKRLVWAALLALPVLIVLGLWALKTSRGGQAPPADPGPSTKAQTAPPRPPVTEKQPVIGVAKAATVPAPKEETAPPKVEYAEIAERERQWANVPVYYAVARWGKVAPSPAAPSTGLPSLFARPPVQAGAQPAPALPGLILTPPARLNVVSDVYPTRAEAEKERRRLWSNYPGGALFVTTLAPDSFEVTFAHAAALMPLRQQRRQVTESLRRIAGDLKTIPRFRHLAPAVEALAENRQVRVEQARAVTYALSAAYDTSSRALTSDQARTDLSGREQQDAAVLLEALLKVGPADVPEWSYKIENILRTQGPERAAKLALFRSLVAPYAAAYREAPARKGATAADSAARAFVRGIREQLEKGSLSLEELVVQVDSPVPPLLPRPLEVAFARYGDDPAVVGTSTVGKQMSALAGLVKRRAYLPDSAPRAGHLVAQLLGKGAGEALPVVREALQDEDLAVGRMAAALLPSVGIAPASLVPGLVAGLSVPGTGQGLVPAQRALLALGAPAVPGLLDALKDKRPLVRKRAVEVLASPTSDWRPQIEPALRVAALDPDAGVRQAAEQGLKQWRPARLPADLPQD